MAEQKKTGKPGNLLVDVEQEARSKPGIDPIKQLRKFFQDVGSKVVNTYRDILVEVEHDRELFKGWQRFRNEKGMTAIADWLTRVKGTENALRESDAETVKILANDPSLFWVAKDAVRAETALESVLLKKRLSSNSKSPQADTAGLDKQIHELVGASIKADDNLAKAFKEVVEQGIGKDVISDIAHKHFVKPEIIIHAFSNLIKVEVKEIQEEKVAKMEVIKGPLTSPRTPPIPTNLMPTSQSLPRQ